MFCRLESAMGFRCNREATDRDDKEMYSLVHNSLMSGWGLKTYPNVILSLRDSKKNCIQSNWGIQKRTCHLSTSSYDFHIYKSSIALL